MPAWLDTATAKWRANRLRPADGATPLFILGPGRCGSTTALRVLNLHPAVHVWGEHEGALAPIAEAYGRLVRGDDIRKFHYDRQTARNIVREKHFWSWYNGFDATLVQESTRRYVETVLAPPPDKALRYWGFKEIRYGGEVAAFLDEIMPGAKFIFLSRAPKDCVRSMVEAWHGQAITRWSDSPGDDDAGTALDAAVQAAQEKWMHITTGLLDFAPHTSGQVLWLDYDRLRDQPQEWCAAIFGHLGLTPPDEALDLITGREPQNSDPALAARVEAVLDGDRTLLAKIEARLGAVNDD